MNLIYQSIREDHEIAVVDTNELYGERGRFRMLQFSDSAVQGALDLDHPERIIFEYPRAILHLMQSNQPGYQNLFIIGHGIGTIPAHCSDRQVKVAEIDQQVVDISRQFFGYDQNNVRIGDGRQLLMEEHTSSCDYIVVDAFTAKGTPQHLVSDTFFQLAADRLRSDGAIIMNLFGKGEHDALIEAIFTTLSGQFSHCKAFVLTGDDRNTRSNILLMGSKEPITYHPRDMAGFHEITLAEGYLILG